MGVYKFKLIVEDNEGFVSEDTVCVDVRPRDLGIIIKGTAIGFPAIPLDEMEGLANRLSEVGLNGSPSSRLGFSQA